MNIHNSAKHDFSNKVVLITGGTGALGTSITKAFIESNATVLSSYISTKVQMQNDNYSKVQLIKANIIKEEEVEKNPTAKKGFCSKSSAPKQKKGDLDSQPVIV